MRQLCLKLQQGKSWVAALSTCEIPVRKDLYIGLIRVQGLGLKKGKELSSQAAKFLSERSSASSHEAAC